MIRPTALALILLAAPVWAQDGGPLSAIDWLSQSVEPPTVVPPLAAQPDRPGFGGVTLPDVSVSRLDHGLLDGVGLLPAHMTGFPATLWSASETATLVDLISAERIETLPALHDLLVRLLLAEAAPPQDATPDAALFLARVDKLLDMGALQQAQALLEAAGPNTPALFRRWFDISLLTGTENAACDALNVAQEVEPTFPARVFCTARGGDWDAAALILNTGLALGDVNGDEAELLIRFLDDSLSDGSLPLPIPEVVTPLTFRMREAIGERLSTTALPRAFAHADLGDTVSWRSRIEAAERLARVGAVDDNVLQDLYTLQKPAASGGVWDRATAFQAFDQAIAARDTRAVAKSLLPVWEAMQTARTEVPLARLYADQIAGIPLTGDMLDQAFRLQLLASDYEAAARRHPAGDVTERFLIGLATGRALPPPEGDAKAATVATAFAAPGAPDALAALMAEGKLGEALLRAIAAFDAGLAGDPSAVSDALATFRAVGLEDIARRAALQYLLLDRTT